VSLVLLALILSGWLLREDAALDYCEFEVVRRTAELSEAVLSWVEPAILAEALEEVATYYDLCPAFCEASSK
jgi:hypothetical protein